MSIDNPKFESIDDYLDQIPESARNIIEKLRQIINDVAPNTVELIRYDMPSFQLGDKYIVHIAAFKNHIGVYGISSEALNDELQPYLREKGTIQFQIAETVPYDLFKKLIKFRVEKEILNQ